MFTTISISVPDLSADLAAACDVDTTRSLTLSTCVQSTVETDVNCTCDVDTTRSLTLSACVQSTVETDVNCTWTL